MQAVAASAVVLALLNLGGGEIVLILALVLILVGARKLPDLGRGLGRGISEFRSAARQVADESDEAAAEAGRSVGGIYGKPSAQALTPDNQVAELYNPAVLQDKAKAPKRWKVMGVERLWRLIRRFVRAIRALSDRM